MGGILIVDDDRTVGGVVLSYLRREEMAGRHLPNGAGLLDTIGEMDPDLLVLDVMLPDGDGVSLCRDVRARHPHLPVILLTARADEGDRIGGLSAGADDYVTKPFSARELMLRIRSVLRRTAAEPRRRVDPDEVLRDGDLEVRPAPRSATLRGRTLNLTAREFDLLAHFLRRPREALSRDEILRDVWEWDYGDRSTVTVHVRRLREKVERDPAQPRRLVTVWGVGYRWDPAPEAVG